jgi:hypothetical protein
VSSRHLTWSQVARAACAAEASGEPYLVAFVHTFHARLAVLGRDREAARAAAVRAADIAEEHGFPLLAGHAAVPLGWAQAGLGEPQAGLAAVERGLATNHRLGQRILIPFHQGLQAKVLLGLEDPQAALDLLNDALAESTDRGGAVRPDLASQRGSRRRGCAAR